MTWYKWLYTFLFIYERDRYYSGGALRYPIKITQKLWDELHERKRSIDEHNRQRQEGKRLMFHIDTTYGTTSNYFEQQIGKRPIVPDNIREIREVIFFAQFIICTGIIIAFLIKHK